MGKGSGAPDGRLAFTPTAIESLTAAMTIALEHKHNYIGTEHLLLGVSRTEGVAARILLQAGMDEASLSKKLESKLGRSAGCPGSQPGPTVNPAHPSTRPHRGSRPGAQAGPSQTSAARALSVNGKGLGDRPPRRTSAAVDRRRSR